ncbi:MAG: DUF4124 domain-containing protein [Sedimenticola sp.]|nr:DUF4124 domain-containing protein [Sedimenticola sp.]
MIHLQRQKWATGKVTIRSIVCWITIYMTAFFPLATLASVYRCPDASGAVLFQQMPCAEGVELELDVRATEWITTPESKPDKRKTQARKRPRQKSQLARESARQEKACWKARQRIEKIEWALRKGYKPARGERLRQQRREQQDYLRQFCR